MRIGKRAGGAGVAAGAAVATVAVRGLETFKRSKKARARRRGEERVSRETLVGRAAYLPKAARALVEAHFSLGMSTEEIALLHRVTPRQMRRRLARLRERLSDACFLLAAHYGDRLPRELAAVARDHWVQGQTLRQMAAARGATLHRVRCDLGVARSLLVVEMSGEQRVPRELARAAIEGANRRDEVHPDGARDST